jgi:hypothetical protein
MAGLIMMLSQFQATNLLHPAIKCTAYIKRKNKDEDGVFGRNGKDMEKDR